MSLYEFWVHFTKQDTRNWCNMHRSELVKMGGILSPTIGSWLILTKKLELGRNIGSENQQRNSLFIVTDEL